MARIRYVKPDFFEDEDISNLARDVRLFYVGLWCQLDRQGLVEERVKFLKKEIFPYDDDITIQKVGEFVAELDSGRYDHLKNTPVVTYCTGGIRCEVLSSLMVNRGFQEVYQLDGGIASYGERFGDSGLWQGSLYVFDNRLSIDFTDDAAVVGRCYLCDAPTSMTANCSDLSCREQFVVCAEHAPRTVCAAHAA